MPLPHVSSVPYLLSFIISLFDSVVFSTAFSLWYTPFCIYCHILKKQYKILACFKMESQPYQAITASAAQGTFIGLSRFDNFSHLVACIVLFEQPFDVRSLNNLKILLLLSCRIAVFRDKSIDKWQRKTQVTTGAAAIKGKLHAFNQVNQIGFNPFIKNQLFQIQTHLIQIEWIGPTTKRYNMTCMISSSLHRILVIKLLLI